MIVDQVARVDVAMSIGDQSQTVTVTGAPPIMQTDSASLGQAIEGTAVRDLPLNGRNVLALVALVPGVVPQGASSSNLSGQNVFAAGNFQIGGGNANQGSILVDGVSVNTSYGNAVELVMDQDSIQEFNVQTHNNTAEFGKYTGGVINMSSASPAQTPSTEPLMSMYEIRYSTPTPFSRREITPENRHGTRTSSAATWADR